MVSPLGGEQPGRQARPTGALSPPRPPPPRPAPYPTPPGQARPILPDRKHVAPPTSAVARETQAVYRQDGAGRRRRMEPSCEVSAARPPSRGLDGSQRGGSEPHPPNLPRYIAPMGISRPRPVANPGRQARARERSGYSPGAKPAWPELTLAGLGHLPGSAEARGPRKALGHALLAGQYRGGHRSRGTAGCPVTRRDRNQI